MPLRPLTLLRPSRRIPRRQVTARARAALSAGRLGVLPAALIAAAALWVGCVGVPSADFCSRETCRGCCNGNVCERGDEAATCGSGGEACLACAGSSVCGAGRCLEGDAGPSDAGGPDDGGLDAGGFDAGALDAGALDAGADAGADAGPPVPGDAGTATTFDALYPPTFRLDDGTGAVTQGPQPRPAKSGPLQQGGYVDVPFGTQVRRITDVGDSADTVTSLRHEYSRRQAFNADSTRFLAQASNGYWYLYDANTLQRLDGGRTNSPGGGAIEGLAGDCEPIWHPTDPDRLWFTANYGGLVWFERNIATQLTSTLFDLTGPLNTLGWTTAARAWFKGEGRPSNDGRWWALLVETAAFTPVGLIMYDRQTQRIVGHLPLTTNRPDHVSTSPLGTAAVVSWYGNASSSLSEEASRPLAQAAGVRAYTRDFSSFQPLAVLGEHSDVALDADGHEVFVMVSFHGQADGVTDGRVFVRRIDSGAAFDTPVNAYAGQGAGIHISGLATRRPGWAVVSKYSGVGMGPYDGQVVLVELKPQGRVLRLAHHRSNVSDYFAEPHATSNADLTRVVFSSDWGATSPFEDYEVLLPSWAVP